MVSGYLELLRVRHASRLLAGTLIGRLPNGTAPLAIVIFTRSEGGSYTLAGVLAALYGVATAVGQPLLGRLVDLYGQPRVQLPAAVLSAAAMAVLALSGTDPLWVACAAVLVSGVATPPLEGGLRALWPSVLGRQERVQRAYALDAITQEVLFVIGPLVVMVLVSVWSPAGALLVVNALGVLGALWVVASEPSRAWRSAPREAHWLGALRARGLRVLLGGFLCVGMALGSISVVAVAYAEARGDELFSTYLLSALGAGALLGGLGYGARQWPGDPERRLRLLLTALSVGYLPLMLAPSSVPLMTLLALVAGVFLAPALACAFAVVDRQAPAGTITEAFSWLVTAFGVGAAVGTAVAGPVVETWGVTAGFAVAGCCGIAGALVVTVGRRTLAHGAVREVAMGAVAPPPVADPAPGPTARAGN